MALQWHGLKTPTETTARCLSLSYSLLLLPPATYIMKHLAALKGPIPTYLYYYCRYSTISDGGDPKSGPSVVLQTGR